MSQGLARAWHEGHPLLWLLWPFTLLFVWVSAVRRGLYQSGIFSVRKFPVPIVVVGNISVGGTGKTPLTLALIERLRAEGFTPGVVSRGYGGKADYPLQVRADSVAGDCGDEPLAIFRRSAVPVVVAPKRASAVQYLLAHNTCDVVICDDGLQHYALARDVEIAVIDGARGVGNGQRLPMGPLREPVSRLAQVQHVVVNGEGFVWPGHHRMCLRALPWINMRGAAFPAPAVGARLHAVAGIGNPARFFQQLQAAGFDVIAHAFADHHEFTAADLAFADDLPVVMTEKDAVKCAALAHDNWWFVPVEAELPEAFYDSLLAQIRAAAASKKR